MTVDRLALPYGARVRYTSATPAPSHPMLRRMAAAWSRPSAWDDLSTAMDKIPVLGSVRHESTWKSLHRHLI